MIRNSGRGSLVGDRGVVVSRNLHVRAGADAAFVFTHGCVHACQSMAMGGHCTYTSSARRKNGQKM